RRVSAAPFGLAASEWMLTVGAVFLQTETELILKSRRVVPRRLLEDGFLFEYPDWEPAAQELCERHRQTVWWPAAEEKRLCEGCIVWRHLTNRAWIATGN